MQNFKTAGKNGGGAKVWEIHADLNEAQKCSQA